MESDVEREVNAICVALIGRSSPTETKLGEGCVLKTMKPFFFLLKDWWGQWSVDRAGVESGTYRVLDLRCMLNKGEVNPHTWLRHVWTRKYSLVGEVLYMNDLATDDEFEAWFPIRGNPRAGLRLA